MTDLTDMELVGQYVRSGSEAAFAELVRRHVNLVYSVALRFTRRPHDAEDVVQAVFVILARKAPGLHPGTILAGWLYETTRLTALRWLRDSIRHQRYEQEAGMQPQPENRPDPAWHQIEPLLERAMSRLKEKDRTLLVLRFFERRTNAEAAAMLGVGEWAARKRAERALDRLRDYFERCGIPSTAAALSDTIAANGTLAAPASLAGSVTLAALAQGATASASATPLIHGALKLMAWTKIKTASVTALVLAAGTTAVVVGEYALSGGLRADHTAVVIKVQWQPGRKYLVHHEDVQTTQGQNRGRMKPTLQVQKMAQDFYFLPVRKLDNDGWQLQLQFEHLALEVTNGSRRVFAADSDQPPGQDARNPVGARLRKMAGARLEYFTDANGKVDRMNGYAELVDRVAGRDAKEQAAFKDLFSEIALSKFGSIFEDTVSQRVVKAGDRWSIKMNVPSNAGDLDLKINCRFKNWEQRGEHRCVHITFTGTIATLPGTDPSLLRARIEDGRISGDLWWDPALGVGVESVQKITARLNLNQNGQAISIPFAEQTRLQLLGIDDA